MDHKKAFDCVDHENFEFHYIGIRILEPYKACPARSLYMEQKALVRTEYRNTEEFEIVNGMRQRCIFACLCCLTRTAKEQCERRD